MFLERTFLMAKLTDQYSIVVWILAGLVALIGFPVGLVVPIYFYIKADRKTGKEQAWLQVSAVLAFIIIEMIAVELGGRLGHYSRGYLSGDSYSSIHCGSGGNGTDVGGCSCCYPSVTEDRGINQ